MPQQGLVIRLGFTAAVIALCTLLPSLVVYSNWSELKLQKDAWTVTGAACPQVDAIPSNLISKRRPPKAFAYVDAGYVHATGLASCAELANDPLWPGAGRYTVCQFNNPGAVTVQTGTARASFLAPPGHRLTVTVRNGKAACVVGGRFSL
jgi:hypothetical protein